MSTEITTAFVKQYHDNIIMLSQQKGSKLKNTVRNETQVGEMGFYDRIGAVTARKRTTRHADTTYSNTPHSRRRVMLVDYDWADLIDKPDKVKMLIDPASSYVQNAVNALGRGIDAEIISAATGTAHGGVDGGTSISFASDGGTTVDSGAATLDLADLTAVRRTFMAADVDMDQKFTFVTTAKQIDALLNIDKLTSSDYATVKALVTGEINTFMGFNFVQTQMLSGTGTSVVTQFCHTEQGILLALGQDVTAKVAEIPTKTYSVQVFASMSVGATRMEGAQVVKITSKDD